MNAPRSMGLHQPITSETIEILVKHHFGTATKMISHHIMQGGLFNTTYKLELEHEVYPHVILRLAPERICSSADPAADPLFSFERTMMSAEPVIYEHYRNVGIPAPHVIVCDDSGKLVPRTYMFMAFIPSVQLDHPSFSAEQKESLYRQLGAYTAAMHRIQGSSFGWPQKDGTIRGSGRWSDVLLAYARETAGKAAAANYMPEAGEEIVTLFEAHRDLFDQVTQPVLVHNDLWEANVLIQTPVQDQPVIAAVIDGDRSMFADREYEAILSGKSASFHAGYGMELDMSPEGQTRRLAYRILSSFFNAYVHEHQVNQPEDGEIFRQRTLSLLKEWKQLLVN